MFAAAVRVLARAATIQLEEAAAAHPRPPTALLKGKERAVPIRQQLRHERAVPETDLGLSTAEDGHNNGVDRGGAASVATSSAQGLQDQFDNLLSESVREPSDHPGPSRRRQDVKYTTPVAAAESRIPMPSDSLPSVDEVKHDDLQLPSIQEISPPRRKLPEISLAESSAKSHSTRVQPVSALTNEFTPPMSELPEALAEEQEDVSALGQGSS